MIDENLLQAFMTLMLCVLGLGVILYFVKRYTAKIAPQTQTVSMKVLGRLPLPKANIYTIQAGDRILIIGTTDHSITTLADITSHQAVSPQNSNVIPTQAHVPDNSSGINPTDNLSFSAFIQSIPHRQKN